MGIFWECMTTVTLVLTVSVVKGMPDFSDLPAGPYCAKMYPAGECCRGRQDECSVPILSVLCYCDEFCQRFREEDCCPDYWTHCQGIEANVTFSPPADIRRCHYRGRDYNEGQTFKINCNVCKCSAMGRRLEVHCEQNRCLQDPELVNEINSNALRSSLTWRARNYSEFSGKTLKEGIQYRLGTLHPSRTVYRMNPVHRIYDPKSLPREFDARSHWPGDISDAADQGWCGASWAISTVRVASDRFAVMSHGFDSVILSAQHLLSCNSQGQHGCNGGHLDRAWMYIRKFGLVAEDCYPWTGTDGHCKHRKWVDLKTAGCAPSNNPFRTELYKVGPAYRLGNESDIMQEIQTSGPVQATMKVYQDFFSYDSGVYKHTPTVELYESGYHSVRIIGWGEDSTVNNHGLSPTKYWLAVNSWGREWGEDGLFRIERGTNECEIESFVLGAWAKTI